MYTVFGTFNYVNFNKPAYLKTRDEALKREMRNAAREWLAAVIPRVPVWTGTSRGTLLPLARYLRQSIPISPLVSKEGKGPGLGETLGGFEFDDAGNQYTFEFTNFLEYFKFNDQNDASAHGFHLTHHTPWEAFEAGQKAFEYYVETYLPQKMPDINDFLEYTIATF